MPDVEGVMGVRLGIFDHDALALWLAAPKITFFLKNGRDDAFCEIFGDEIEIEITSHCLDSADAFGQTDQLFDCFSNFLCQHRDFDTFARFCFICRRLKK